VIGVAIEFGALPEVAEPERGGAAIDIELRGITPLIGRNPARVAQIALDLELPPESRAGGLVADLPGAHADRAHAHIERAGDDERRDRRARGQPQPSAEGDDQQPQQA